MKRAGHLTERIAELDNLYLAYTKACRGKQRKQEVRLFQEHFDENICELREQILSGHVEVGHYRFFTIHDPKERIICAAPFRERVLHHALMNVCHDYFDRSLIDSTYATRPGKGVYAALDKAISGAAKYQYLVKLDFRKYYDSICHERLTSLLCRKFKDKRLLGIFRQIIESYHSDTGRGLPIGNLTSQYFANAYLSAFDHFAKESLHAHTYIRYMDDILMAGNDKKELMNNMKRLMEYASSELGLTLKPPVCQKNTAGVVFLGYRVLPHYYTLSGRSKRRFRTKLLKYEQLLADGHWSDRQYEEHILPLLSFVNHARSSKFRHACISIVESRQYG